MSDVEAAPATKQCPFCAETIQAAAVVCRYCGRDLTEKTAVIAPDLAGDRALLQQEIARFTSQGWQVVSQTETTVQIRKPRQWSAAGLVFLVIAPAIGGLLWYPLFGVALIGLVLVLAAYLSGKDALLFVEASQLRQRAALRAASDLPTIITDGRGSTCSACGQPVRADALMCKHCKKVFDQTATHDPTAPAHKIAGVQPGAWVCSRCGRQLHPQAEGCAFCKQRFV